MAVTHLGTNIVVKGGTTLPSGQLIPMNGMNAISVFINVTDIGTNCKAKVYPGHAPGVWLDPLDGTLLTAKGQALDVFKDGLSGKDLKGAGFVTVAFEATGTDARLDAWVNTFSA